MDSDSARSDRRKSAEKFRIRFGFGFGFRIGFFLRIDRWQHFSSLLAIFAFFRTVGSEKVGLAALTKQQSTCSSTQLDFSTLARAVLFGAALLIRRGRRSRVVSRLLSRRSVLLMKGLHYIPPLLDALLDEHVRHKERLLLIVGHFASSLLQVRMGRSAKNCLGRKPGFFDFFAIFSALKKSDWFRIGA